MVDIGGEFGEELEEVLKVVGEVWGECGNEGFKLRGDLVVEFFEEPYFFFFCGNDWRVMVEPEMDNLLGLLFIHL